MSDPVAPEGAIEALYRCANHLHSAHINAVAAVAELARHPRHESAIQLAHIIEGAEGQVGRLHFLLACEEASAEHQKRWEEN
jgi:hypothetical protein